MEVFVARQPILNSKQEIVAYELLYRGDQVNQFPDTDGDQATLDVFNSLIQIGFNELSAGRPCFVNFTENILKQDLPRYFQPEMLVIEILETVIPTKELINICYRLKSRGFKLALDDFVLIESNNYFREMLSIADIIKVDIKNTSRDQQLEILRALKDYPVELLAEKVETRKEYEECLKDGYKYFQGYFFSKPVILSSQDAPILNHVYFNVMEELAKPEADISKMTKIIEIDLAFSYKLLKFINAPVFGLIYEIKSIRQAITLLGLNEFRKWLCVLTIRGVLDGKKGILLEVFKLALSRGKTCELIAIAGGKRKQAASYFMTGLFSLIDTLLKRPLDQIMKELPLDSHIKDALLGKESPFKGALDLALAMEQAKWEVIKQQKAKYGLPNQKLFDIYTSSLKWTNQVWMETTD